MLRWEESGHLVLGLLVLSIPSFLSSPIVAEQVSYEARVGGNGLGETAKIGVFFLIFSLTDCIGMRKKQGVFREVFLTRLPGLPLTAYGPITGSSTH